jgi:hypothetical protein
LLVAAICALKSTLIPTCILFFTFSYFFYIIGTKTKHKAIYEFCLGGYFIVSCLFYPGLYHCITLQGLYCIPYWGKVFTVQYTEARSSLPNSVIDSKAAIQLKLN